jgi:serine/threonine protein kinase
MAQEQIRQAGGNDDDTAIAGLPDGAPREIRRYLIEGVLGEGAMGVVYKGYDRSIMRHVAIKTIRKEHLTDTMSGNTGRDSGARPRRPADSCTQTSSLCLTLGSTKARPI